MLAMCAYIFTGSTPLPDWVRIWTHWWATSSYSATPCVMRGATLDLCQCRPSSDVMVARNARRALLCTVVYELITRL